MVTNSELTQHPLSAAFPALAADDFAALVEDVRRCGLRSDIVVSGGQVLDGWHRYRACLASGTRPRFAELPDGVGPIGFVLSANLHRRHLSASQRAEVALRCSEWRGVGRNPAPGAGLESEAGLAESARVSVRTIQQTKKAIRAGLGDAVREGKLSAKAAAEQAKPPPSEPRDPPIQKTEWSAQEQEADATADLEAMLAVFAADDRLSAAMAEVAKAQRETATIQKLYDAQTRELAAVKRDATRWMAKAKKSAACQDCMTALERP